MMLLNLDRLAGTVNPDRQCFYVVEILEAPNAESVPFQRPSITIRVN